MSQLNPKASVTAREILRAWGKILAGDAPLLSIEITRECPLSCPGCYAYGDAHLGGGKLLSELNDFRGAALVEGVLGLVRKHRPMHVSLVGGEPLIRHRELSAILPALSAMNVFTLVVTSGIVRVPAEWTNLPRVRVTISVDGLPEHHDVRRKPATYERILKSIAGCSVNLHWVITRPMLARPAYFEDYISFWSERREVERIWISFYTPQIGEESPEMLTREERTTAANRLSELAARYPKMLLNRRFAEAFLEPPQKPRECLFAKMSVNYSADLATRVEPCVFGGQPDCSQCGCAASIGLHWIRDVQLAGPLKVGHFIAPSIEIGLLVNRLRDRGFEPPRWGSGDTPLGSATNLVQIET